MRMISRATGKPDEAWKEVTILHDRQRRAGSGDRRDIP
jgi:hypothetical protein